MEPEKHPKPENYDQLYPGRFMKAGELLGKPRLLTIAAVDVEELMDIESKAQDATKPKAVLSFKEDPKKMVFCKTNGICLKAMFGAKLKEWVGKRIEVHPEVWNGKDCIRIGGSPDIAADMDVEIKLPKRRAFKKTMKKLGAPSGTRLGNGPRPAPLPESGPVLGLLAALEKVEANPDAVGAWWDENINAIEALDDGAFKAMQDAAQRRSGA